MNTLKEFSGWNESPYDTFQKMASTISNIEGYQVEKQTALCGLMNSVAKLKTFKIKVENALLEPFQPEFLNDINVYRAKIPDEFFREGLLFTRSRISNLIIHGLKHCHVTGEIIHPNDRQVLHNLIFSFLVWLLALIILISGLALLKLTVLRI